MFQWNQWCTNTAELTVLQLKTAVAIQSTNGCLPISNLSENVTSFAWITTQNKQNTESVQKWKDPCLNAQIWLEAQRKKIAYTRWEARKIYALRKEAMLTAHTHIQWSLRNLDSWQVSYTMQQTLCPLLKVKWDLSPQVNAVQKTPCGLISSGPS